MPSRFDCNDLMYLQLLKAAGACWTNLKTVEKPGQYKEKVFTKFDPDKNQAPAIIQELKLHGDNIGQAGKQNLSIPFLTILNIG